MSVVHHTAIVSGGNTGIGAAIARGLLAEGYDVISLSRRKPDWSHPKLSSREVDLLDATATRQAAAEIAAKVAITHVVHNAGAIRAKLLEEVVDEDVGALAQLHFGAAIALAQAALPGMKQARFGRIVLLSSRAALGAATRTVYSATKAGIIGMARTWALELPLESLSMSGPGPIGRYRDAREDVAEPNAAAGTVDSARRLGKSADVARAVSFFSSPDADFITGQTLYVCGGASIGSISI
jgi:NAD(P)-dependent dehydrogenase (short-subunit alcohol dehydrogenase family)